MKICFIVGVYPKFVGGAEYQAKILAENLIKNSDVFYISYGENKDYVSEIDGIKVYNIRQSNSVFYIDIYHKVNEIIKIEKPNVIYHRVLVSYTIFLSSIAKKNNIPFILHISDEFSIKFDNSIKSMIKKILLRQIVRNNVKIITQTQKQSELLLCSGIKADIILPNIQYITECKPKDKDFINIVWIGKVNNIKRLELFVDLANNNEDKDYKFIVISRFYNDKLSKDVLDRISRSKNIINMGEQTNDFINDYLQNKAYLLVNTSVSEGFSNTFIQAWFRGVPVVSLNSNPGDIFYKHKFGYFCNDNVEKMDEYINTLCKDKKLYDDMSIYSYNMSIEMFSVEKQFGRFKEFVNNVIKG